ncbi:DUF6925 family protein [Sphingomonas pseudosanguinis]|uniref:Uncharacterized protein n=1 Tax=Sphingomonas pseudosanguinis TaxID=413712 RepID=A0A7W6F1J7_9SPHN|nr:hypothetical protein [Sphingomonas pseudosanguinis]MBB3877771.1 hypothetical protein [Sphingomonas pseudosanguinis]MBN3537648.1 hypothetical protein [Sphingomonas pseudosanguinis]
MQPAPFSLIADLIEDPANGWSIGSFGAIGEFMRDPDEPTTIRRSTDCIEVVTGRGAIRVVDTELTGVAWDTLSSDGETWGHALALCVAVPPPSAKVIRPRGPDHEALRDEDRHGLLYDLGVGTGCVTMAIRTQDAELIAALDAAVGQPVLASGDVMECILRSQPHRVLISPAGRVEVYQPIPMPGGESPEGPHTHLLPKLIGKDRPHSANTPIPEGWQSALTLHPPSPWRTPLGERRPFCPRTDAMFAPLLQCYQSAEDEAVRAAIITALDEVELPWPDSRRGRHKARVVLRRLYAAGDIRASAWRMIHDSRTDRTEADAVLVHDHDPIGL